MANLQSGSYGETMGLHDEHLEPSMWILPESLKKSLMRLGNNIGQPMPVDARHTLENYFGLNLAQVRVIRSEVPHVIGAEAFAYGDSIFVTPEHADFSSDHGMKLLCHELTHVVQARLGLLHDVAGDLICDTELESQAHRVGNAFGRTTRQSEWNDHVLSGASPTAQNFVIQCQARGQLDTNYIGLSINPVVPVAPAGVGFSAVNCMNEVWSTRALAFARAKNLLGKPASLAKRTYHWYTMAVPDNHVHVNGEGLNINGRGLIGPNANQRTGRYYDFGHGKLIVEHTNDPNSTTQTGAGVAVQRAHFHIATYNNPLGMYMAYRTNNGIHLAGAAGSPGPLVYQIDRRYNFEFGDIHNGGTHEHHHIYYQ